MLENYEFIANLIQLDCIDGIILFGSRARGDNSARADIDIAINCPNATDSDWLKILDIIEEADTLLKIDCVRFDELKQNSSLKQNISREGILIYAKNHVEI